MRYHLSALIVVCLVASVLLGLNLSPWPNCWAGIAPMERLGKDPPGWCYGWPAPFAWGYQPDLIAAFARGLRLRPLFVDLGFAVFLTLGAGWINERWLNFKDAMRPFRRNSAVGRRSGKRTAAVSRNSSI